MSAGGNVDAQRATIVGGDYHRVTKTTRIRLGIWGIAVAVLAGGYVTYNVVIASPSSVAAERGKDGARHTVEAILAAEAEGNASDWCELATSADPASCTSYLTSVFASVNPLRDEGGDLVVDAVAGSDQSAQVKISMGEEQIGDVPMEWTGERWRMNSIAYMLALNNGGLRTSAVAAERGCGILLGQSTGCPK